MELPLPARAAFALAACAWMLLGPIDRQVLGREDTIVKAWRMYSGAAIDECVVDYWVPTPDGGWEEISRTGVLHGEPAWWRVPRPQRHVRGVAAVGKVARRLCAELGIDELYADARCSDTRGWQVVEARERDLCPR